MHMYRTAKVDMPEYFRAELSQLMTIMRSIIVQYILNRDDKCEVGHSTLYFLIYRQMCEIFTHFPILIMLFQRLLYHGMVPDGYGKQFFLLPCEPYRLKINIFRCLFFTEQVKLRGCGLEHNFICEVQPQ